MSHSAIASNWQALTRAVAEAHPWLQGAALASLFMAAHPWILEITTFYWYLPAGVRFVGLLLLPKRLWPWLILGEWGARWMIEVSFGAPFYAPRIYAVFPQPLGSVVAVALLRRRGPLPRLDLPAGMLGLLGAVLLSAGLECLANVNYILLQPQGTTLTLPVFALSVFLGDLMGVLVIAPAVLALVLWKPLEMRRARVAADIVLGLALPILGFFLLQSADNLPLTRDYLRILIAAPVVYFAFRYGWRGAALCLAVLSFSVARFHVQNAGYVPGEIAAVQMLLAVMGGGALLFGSAIDALRNHRRELAIQNQNLLIANTRLQTLTRELRNAARRNLQSEEEQRRRIAGELHDELGQNLTALQTRIKLATDDRHADPDTGSTIDGIVLRMRQSLRSLMDSLRPAALDEFGLLHAIRHGPISELLQHAGVHYHFTLQGEPALLDALNEETRIAVWRMVQEAATNAVKHAHAAHFRVTLRIGLRHDTVWLLLDIRDDGIGLSATRSARRSHGLQAMRDRMLALDGVFRVVDAQPGARLRVLLRQPLPDTAAVDQESGR